MDKDLEDFLTDLSWLTVKYGFIIGGCGCCGSPYIGDVMKDKIVGDNLEWDNDEQIYKINCKDVSPC